VTKNAKLVARTPAVLLFTLTVASAYACGDSESPPESGNGGSGGSAGKGATAGSAGKGGVSGSSGKGAGAGGVSGSGAGSAGRAGGGSGGAASGASGANASGEAGAGGEAGDAAGAGGTPNAGGTPSAGGTPNVGGTPSAGGAGDGGTASGRGGEGGEGGEVDPGPPNYVFVTSVARTPAEIDGLSGADALCNERAMAGGIFYSGPYVAWLSTSALDARQRLGNARGWVRTDGLPVVDRVSDLVAGRIYHPPLLDEFGTMNRGQTVTGTSPNGTRNTNSDRTFCNDWTENTNGETTTGNPSATTDSWTSSGAPTCDSGPFHLYCFGVSRASPIEEPAETGRLAFVTSASYLIGGAETPDAVCAAEASAADVAGSFKAFIAFEGVSPASRFDLNGAPWVRPDGVRIVGDAGELASDSWLAPINVQLDGTYIGNYAVWFGAPRSDQPGSTSTCSDWTDDDAQTYAGYLSAASSWPIVSNQVPCSADYAHLYCLEE
jgi:hypothetical protein